MYCRNCGNIVAEGVASCSSCGFDPVDGNNYCPKCGHFCIPGDVECVQCKASLVAPARLSVRQDANIVPPLSQQPEPQPQAQPFVPPQMQSQPQSQPSQQPYIETKVGPKFLASDQRYCRNCGLVIPADAYKCPFCDSGAGSNYCPKCGSGTTSSDTVCSVCSSPLTIRPNVGYIPSQPPVQQQSGYSNQHNRQQYAPPQNPQQYNGYPYGNNQYYGNTERYDWLITLLLCIFLGAFGVHRFYTKHYVAGVIQLLTFNICCIWWVIDIIMIVTDSYTDGNGNKLKHDN